MKKHNFFAGPSILSQYTIQSTAEAVLNFENTGLSLLEVSHREKEFVGVMDKARSLVKELLEVPAGYEVLFLGGGASLQFCMAPYNFMEKKAAYTETGTWATNAIKEARFFGEVEVVGSSKDKNFSYIPKGYTIPEDVDYFHYTSNNTIFGTQVHHDPEVACRMICDMSSDIFSRPVDISKYDLIYGGAQKNLAPAGATLVIVKEEALGRMSRPIPTMLDYRTHIKGDSMFNTPPVLPIYSAMKTLEWYKELGGIQVMQQMNEAKAGLLYNEIDRSRLFRGTAATEDRSLMNICFVMNDEYKELEAEFDKFTLERGLLGLKGHRSVGGFRASTYNALPIESVQVLVDAMKEFERKI